MDIRLYNSMSRKIEAFSPLIAGKVSLYQCGPTVYDTPHIGNFRTFVMYDLIRRVFEYNAYEVDQVMNITDVDDKTIRKSHESGQSLEEVTRKYETMFLEGLDSLNILKPKHILRATEHIKEMISLIEALLDKGFAYRSEDGIYMSVEKVKDYGMLANIHLDKADKNRSRVKNDEYDKENPSDFALWKFKSQDDGPVFWEASFGAGRPGWHIECSAMAMEVLGPTIDIHAGGSDLLFPHHTNEVAQSESATGKQFVRYWMHGAFMNISDEKMAKSKKNFLKLEDLDDNSISALAFRYWLLTAHYRSPVNFTFEAVKAAQTALIRLITVVGAYPEGGSIIDSYKERFNSFINDDLNLAQAIALAWEIIKDQKASDADKRATLLDFDKVFGLKLDTAPKTKPVAIPPEIQALAEAREIARSNKDWTQADALRDEIAERGYAVDDTPAGIVVKPLE